MTVGVKLHTTLKKFAPEGSSGGALMLEVPEGATVATVIDSLGIPRDFVGAAFVGSARAELDRPLAEGEEVNLLAPIGGG